MPEEDPISSGVARRPFNRPVLKAPRLQHTETVTMDSQISLPSGEKVKHIAYLKTPKSVIRHHVGMRMSGGMAVLGSPHYPYLC